MRKFLLRFPTVVISAADVIVFFFILVMVLESLPSGDVDYPGTMAAYLGSWAPAWIIAVPVLLTVAAFIVLVADNEWWLGWFLHICAVAIPIYAFVMEQFVYPSAEPDWDNGLFPFGSFMMYVFFVLLFFAVFGFIVSSMRRR
ncbi:MAG: hypothetical protein IJP50_02290 [Paludibacteraceae bacterium]|nr:hypothetical protein [Paludibacteraceae bacterium]